MSAFDNWFETYDRDGGELMLYNTIDLEAAYKAGMLRGAEIVEGKLEIVRDYTYEYGAIAALENAANAIRKEVGQ